MKFWSTCFMTFSYNNFLLIFQPSKYRRNDICNQNIRSNFSRENQVQKFVQDTCKQFGGNKNRKNISRAKWFVFTSSNVFRYAKLRYSYQSLRQSAFIMRWLDNILTFHYGQTIISVALTYIFSKIRKLGMKNVCTLIKILPALN